MDLRPSSLFETIQRHSVNNSKLPVQNLPKDGLTNGMFGFMPLQFLINHRIISIFLLVSFNQWGVSIFDQSCAGKIIWADLIDDKLSLLRFSYGLFVL